MNFEAVEGLLAAWQPPTRRLGGADRQNGDGRVAVEADTREGSDTFENVRRGGGLARLRAAAGPDWAEIVDRPEVLQALALALERRWQMAQGQRPAAYTQAAVCDGCGPVWLWPGAPGRVLACPWCHLRSTVVLPRPMVQCGDCWHFEASAGSPTAGLGACGTKESPPGNPTRTVWPTKVHRCADWRPR